MRDFRPVRLSVRSAGAALLILTLATCDALTAPKTEHVTLTWVGDTAVTAGLTVPVSVAVTVGGNAYGNPRFDVSSSDTSILKVTGNGDSLRAVRLGQVTVTAQLVNVILSGNAPDLKQTLLVSPASVHFSRSADTLHSLGENLTPSIIALDAKGDSIPGVTYTWVSSDTLVAKISSRGQITTVTNGQSTVRAIVEGDTASLPLTVQQLLVHFAITPPFAVTLNAISAETTLVAAGRDSLGSPIVGAAATPSWLVQNTNIASVDQSGHLTALANGLSYVYAVRGLARDSIQANIIQQATRLLLTSSPTGFAIPSVGGTLTLGVVAFDRLNNPVTNDQPTIVSLDPAIAQVVSATRIITGIGTGVARIVATLDGVADTIRVTVNNTPTKLVLSADTASIAAVGDTIQLTATILNQLGGVITGLTPFWYTTDSTVVTVLQTGRIVALKTGGTRVIAVYQNISDTAVVLVNNGAATLTILNRNDTLPSIGDTMTIPVQILNSRGQPLPPSAATWTSNDPTIATVTSNALLTSVGVGKTVVHAVAGLLRDSAIVVVTNNPTRIVLNSTLDTMTARGQTLQYTAQLTNQAGNPITGTVTWTSSNTSVATVNATGIVTALANGTTIITAASGSVRATATVVVRSPGTLIVDNSTLDTSYFGTGKAPYLHIADGVNAAVPGDTVFVRVGAHPYSEEVVVNKAIVLQGDPTAYLANGRDPTKLPLLSHDTGTAGILVPSPARVVIRTIAIRHTLDGPAINASTAAIAINQVFVNPSGDPFNSGRGILVQSTTAATIDTSAVSAVHGYGVQFRNVTTGRVSTTTVVGVTLSTGADSTYGAGIAVIGGSSDQVNSDAVRIAGGPEILIDSSASATVSSNNVAGEEQLMRVLASSGAQVTGNAFNTQLQSGETYNGNSATDGRSALELNQASAASVSVNTFTDATASGMDHIRLIGTRTPAALVSNTFQGGRWNVRSETSDWSMSSSSAVNSVAAVALTNADTVTLSNDNFTNGYGNCIQFTGAGGSLTITSATFNDCAPARTGAPAISQTSTEGSLQVTGSTFIGDWARAVDVKGGHNVVLRGNTAFLNTSTPTYPGSTSGGVFDLTADASTVVGNTITQLSAFTGIFVDAGNVRVDSNLVTENGLGLAIGNVISFEGSGNDVFDNDTAGIVNNTASLVNATNNFWGDSLGPRLSSNPQASGDSVVGTVTFTPFNSAPTYAGGRLSAKRAVRGNGQTAPAGSTLPEPFDVRVVDANGRPVSNVQVTFQVTTGAGTLNGSGTTVMIATGRDGLARATLTLGASPGTNTVVANVAGLGSVTFTATGQ